MDPVTGTQPSALISTSIKAFTNLEASCFNSGSPFMSGYRLATPFCKASISAFTPTAEGGRPGTPISIFIYSTPESASAFAAIALTSRIVAFDKSAICISLIASSTNLQSIGVFFIWLLCFLSVILIELQIYSLILCRKTFYLQKNDST